MTISNSNEGFQWVPLMEYATKTGVSISTLRRQIKAKKITFKLDNGRYLIWDESVRITQEINQSANLQLTIGKLQHDLQKAQEEIAELKTLIALYEEKNSSILT